jgi:hypothetical protein
VNISHDLLFPREERSVGFPALLSIPAASWPAFRNFEITLTSDHAAIYHPKRWDESKLAHERLIQPAQQKRKLLSLKGFPVPKILA